MFSFSGLRPSAMSEVEAMKALGCLDLPHPKLKPTGE